jgi:exosortase
MTHVIYNSGLMLGGGVMPRRWVVPVAFWMLVAVSPVIYWFGLRLDDGSDEPLGLLVLALAAWLGWRERAILRATHRAQICGAMMIFGSALAIPYLPPLLRAVLAVVGVAVFLGLHHRAGLLGLMLLSLPVTASLQFYLGYPLRWISAEGSVFLLEMGGAQAERAGAEILIAGKVLGVDPACSGVRMLWHACVAAMGLAAFHRLSWRHSVMVGVMALVLVVPANVIRAVLLVLEEVGPWRDSGLIHGGVGLLCFVIILLPMWWFAAKRSRPAGAAAVRLQVCRGARVLLMASAFFAPILAASTPRHPVPAVAGELPVAFEFDGITLPLEALPPTAAEQAFAKSFPGRLSSHRWGDRQVILREVHTATRRLHPSRDCFRAAGFQTTEAITVIRPDGDRWSHFTATRGGERFEVLERVISLRDGSSWTDAAAWFWHALRHPLNGPWRAETVISG